MQYEVFQNLFIIKNSFWQLSWRDILDSELIQLQHQCCYSNLAAERRLDARKNEFIGWLEGDECDDNNNFQCRAFCVVSQTCDSLF
jgi:hypothetical protein